MQLGTGQRGIVSYILQKIVNLHPVRVRNPDRVTGMKFFRKYHKWPGLIFTLFILFFAVSGIILNHRELLSSFDINRKLLPKNYSYRNWNLAAVKGQEKISPDTILLYGNIGVWLTDRTYREFNDFNQGFPKGIDNRKVSSVSFSRSAGLYAGTLFGLYRYDRPYKKWREVTLPVTEKRIVKVLPVGDTLLVMTRSFLLRYTAADGFSHAEVLPVPAGEDDDGKASLFKTLWVIHSGEIYGTIGKLIVDLVGISFIIICITGLIYFFMPYILKTMRNEAKSRMKGFNLFSLRWHNRLGSWLVIFLLLTTMTGMFLRPPLLIPVASARVGKIPYTEMDDPNPWFDRFRDILYDPSLHRFLVATSEGIYYSDDYMQSPLKRFEVQPPVSVMGINVFDRTGPGQYRIGSFSGIFSWDPAKNLVIDDITRTPYVETGNGGSPFGAISVAGYIRTSDSADLIFDYGGGVIALNGRVKMTAMPEKIISASPISLWNACLEIHTGRIFEPFLGNFYILIVPVIGLSAVFIIITGFFSWYLARRKKRALNLSGSAV
jgi:hypothetical protein